MNRRALFGLLALLPAALNVSPATARGLLVPLCSGNGLAESVLLVPAGGTPEVPGKEQPGCCAKACHTGSRKKISARHIDTGQ